MQPYYEDDLITLYLGDCLDVTIWTSCDALVTDPPYGRKWRQGRKMTYRTSTPHYEATSRYRHGIPNDDSTTVRDQAIALWYDHGGQTRPGIIFGDPLMSVPEGAKLAAVYAKSPAAGFHGTIGRVRRSAEMIYLIGKWPGPTLGGRYGIFTSKQQPGGPAGVVHASGGVPHAKPLDLMNDLVTLLPEEATVADPFAGSGATLIAAARTKRRAIGVEISEEFCHIAATRLAAEYKNRQQGEAFLPPLAA